MRRGIDVLVGTCGRIKDLLDRGTLVLSNVEYVILDEADTMLDMGFDEQVEVILDAIPAERKPTIQTLLFSATIPDWGE